MLIILGAHQILLKNEKHAYISLLKKVKLYILLSLLDHPNYCENQTNSLGSVQNIQPFKALGPDGMHAGFYQRKQKVVEDVVVREVCSIFSTGVMPSHLNQTLITLIPKCIGANCLSLYRPISLYIIIYKIITKIIVQRLRPFLDKLVSPLQATFVPRRKGLDNMIIVQELIHTMRTKRGKQGYMAIN